MRSRVAAVRPHLQIMVRAAVTAGSGGAVAQVLQVWRDNGAFDEETLSQLAPTRSAASNTAQAAVAGARARQHLPVSTGIGHGLAPAAVSVGLMASCIKQAVGSGVPRWSPVDYATLAHVPPAIEPGRLDARVARSEWLRAHHRWLDGAADHGGVPHRL